ncbi:MAG: hypothetical protein IPM42_13565 [Saprospiraceae bacterium]|nr:hypothetical protein [Saprospiraceae bacterium]
MLEYIKNLLEKSFWPLMGCYVLYFIYQIYSYFYGVKYVVDKQFYNNWFMGKMVTVGLIVGVAMILKIWGKTRIASLILGVPAVITTGTFLIIMAVWLFLALAFILFGKS